MDDSESSSTVQITGTILIIAFIVFFFLIFISILLYLTTKWFPWRSIQDYSPSLSRGSFMRRRRRRRFLFILDEDIHAVRRGLDTAILKLLPIVAFQNKDFEDGLECAVCLSEIDEGENTRLLPVCNHGFHVECIDMWFQSHSTCPLCRTRVSTPPPPSSGGSTSYEHIVTISEESNTEASTPVASLESATLPTNVLIWGDETRVSTARGNGVLRSDLEEGSHGSIHSRGDSSMELSSSIVNAPNEQDAGRAPIPMHFKFLTRLLSWERKVAPLAGTSSPRKV